MPMYCFPLMTNFEILFVINNLEIKKIYHYLSFLKWRFKKVYLIFNKISLLITDKYQFDVTLKYLPFINFV